MQTKQTKPFNIETSRILLHFSPSISNFFVFFFGLFFSAERISLERQPISPTLGNVPFLLYKITNVVCIICRFGNTYGYGFAFGLSSPYTPLFNMALFRLQKDFKISSLSHKWTKEGVKCEMMDNFEKQQQEGQTFLTLEAPISICIFSLVFSIHFLWY